MVKYSPFDLLWASRYLRIMRDLPAFRVPNHRSPFELLGVYFYPSVWESPENPVLDSQ